MRVFYSLIFILTVLASCKKEGTALQADRLMAAENLSGKTSPGTSYGVCDYKVTGDTAWTNNGWTKVFEDGFDGTAVDTVNTWKVWNGGAFNNELQYYQGNNLSVDSGWLKITAKKENATGPTNPWNATPKNFTYTSSRIESRRHFSANADTTKVRMAARIKLPAGYGMWPAFWAYGDPWPTQGEIDILEAKGQEPTKFYSSYWYGPNETTVNGASATVTSGVSLQTCWHIYELQWEQNTLSTYFDGKLVNTKTAGWIPDMFGKHQRITLNLAVGGDFFGTLRLSQIVTGTLRVDWVKVFIK